MSLREEGGPECGFLLDEELVSLERLRSMALAEQRGLERELRESQRDPWSPWLNERHYSGTWKARRITARSCVGDSPGLTQSGNSSSNQPRVKELIKP